MSTVIWYEENHVIFVQHHGVLNQAKVISWNQAAADLMDAAMGISERVHIIVDATQVTSVELDIQTILNESHVLRLTEHPLYSWGVYVGNKQNPLYVFLASVIGQKLNESVKFFDTEHEAIEFLRTQDIALSHLNLRHLVNKT